MKLSVKKLFEQSITEPEKEISILADLEEKKKKIEEAFVSFMKGKGIDIADYEIITISDTEISFSLVGVPNFIFFLSYVYNFENGQVDFSDFDFKKKEIEMPEEHPEVKTNLEIAQEIAESLEINRNLFSATNSMVDLFKFVLKSKKRGMPNVYLTDEEVKEGEQIWKSVWGNKINKDNQTEVK